MFDVQANARIFVILMEWCGGVGVPADVAPESMDTSHAGGVLLQVASAGSRTQDFPAARAISRTLVKHDSMDSTESRKRAASRDLSEPTTPTGSSGGLMIAALPTLHEPNIIAAPAGTYLAYATGEADGELQVIHATVEWDQNYYAAKNLSLIHI